MKQREEREGEHGRVKTPHERGRMREQEAEEERC